MAGSNVSDLMGHEPRKLGLAVDYGDQPSVDIQKTTRQRKNSVVRRVDDFDSEGHLRVRVPDKVLRQPGHITGHFRIGNIRRATVNCRGHRLAQGALSFERVQVNAVSNIALADSIDVVLIGWWTRVPRRS